MSPTGGWAAGRLRSLAVCCLLALVAVAGAGCQVATSIRVTTDATGRGTVGVTVTLDRAAVAEVGGPAALAAQLQVGDLVRAGWQVAGPRQGAGSTTVITATHPFASWPEASGLVADLAGSGPPSSRPFRLQLSRSQSLWRTHTSLTGVVDLRCGLACFGDSALQRITGSPVGVDAGSIAAQFHEQPAQAFTFSVTAQLPGTLTRTNAPSRQGATVMWQPRLGQVVAMSAQTRTWNTAHIRAAAVGAGVVFVLLMAGASWWWRRARRRRRGRHLPRPGGESLRETVTPGS